MLWIISIIVIFFKRIYYRTNNTKTFKGLYNANIISVNNKVTLSQEWELNTKSMKYCKYFFNNNIFVPKLYKISLKICLQYKKDFLVIFENKPVNIIKAKNIYAKFYNFIKFYISKYLNIVSIVAKTLFII